MEEIIIIVNNITDFGYMVKMSQEEYVSLYRLKQALGGRLLDEVMEQNMWADGDALEIGDVTDAFRVIRAWYLAKLRLMRSVKSLTMQSAFWERWG